MELSQKSALLRIFIGESDQYDGRPLYEAIVQKAREQHMAGSTVIRGAMGYGLSTKLHRSNYLEISQDLPLIVEIVDEADKIEAFRPHLRPMLGSALVTLEDITVLRYGAES